MCQTLTSHCEATFLIVKNMSTRYRKPALAICTATILSIGLAACSQTPDNATPTSTNNATPSAADTPQPTTSNAATDKPQGGNKDPFDKVLSGAPSGSQYAKADITGDGKEELLLKAPNTYGEQGSWPVVEIYDSNGSKYSASVNGHEGFWVGSADAGYERTSLQTTADHKGLLYSSWMGTSPEVSTKLYAVQGNAIVDSGQQWDYRWPGGDSSIQTNAPADLKNNAQDINWKDVGASGGNAPAGGNQQSAPASSNSRSKADFPYFTSGHTGTAPNPSEANTTSPEFGSAVYQAFISNWVATGDSQPTLQVSSPVTGQSYSMSCADQSAYGFVLCQGGNNAKVYIYRPIDPSVTKPMDLQYG